MDKPKYKYGWALLTAAGCAAAALIMGLTVYSSDDYWYSTFMDGGFARWLELMRYHYESFNGRMLVHAAAQLILHFGTWFFAAVGTAVCLWIPLAAARASQSPALPAAALFMVGLMLMPLGMLARCLTWISAFCNYALPTAMIMGEILLLNRDGERRRALSCLSAVLVCFTCGATTEQSGLLAVCVALFYLAVRLFTRPRLCLAPLLGVLSAAAGVVTIFLSPATRTRLDAESAADTLAEWFGHLVDHFVEYAGILNTGRTIAALLALFFIAAALGLRRSGAKTPVWIPFLIAAVLPPATLFTAGDTRAWLYLAVFALLLVCAIALLCRGRRAECLLTLCAVGSVVVMLPTNTGGERVMLPFYLYILTAAALMAGRELIERPALGLAAAAIALAGMIAYRVPVYEGFLCNYRIEQRNREYVEEAKETGVLYYDMDYDLVYTHTKAYADGYFYDTWFESTGLDRDTTKVYFLSEGRPAVYVNGERLTSPALAGSQGQNMLPLRGIVEGLGGTVDTVDGGISVSLAGRAYSITYPSWNAALISWPGGLEVERHLNYFQTLLDERAFTDAFGLTVTASADGSALQVSF